MTTGHADLIKVSPGINYGYAVGTNAILPSEYIEMTDTFLEVIGNTQHLILIKVLY
jgi:hypothetical protein